MKKYFYSLFAAASMMLAVTSCSQEEDFVQESSGELTTFSVSLSGAVQSRTAGDGKTVDKLYYRVYQGDSNEPVFPVNGNGSVDISNNLTAQVQVPLLKGESYNIIFWAQKDGNGIYTIDDLRTITVDYNSTQSNKEEYDAFYNALNDFTADNKTHTIELRRPFAQLNLGTGYDDNSSAPGDWQKAQQALLDKNTKPVTHSQVTVKGLANTFNPLTGVASGNEEAIFTSEAITEEIFKVTLNGQEKEYINLSLNYLLVPCNKAPQGTGAHIAIPSDEKALVDVTYTLYRGANNVLFEMDKIASVPVQRNYRTNIIGDLLTGTGFDVIIKPEDDKPATNVQQITNATDLEAALRVNEENIVIDLIGDPSARSTEAPKTVYSVNVGANADKFYFGGEKTKTITINANGHTINFIHNNTDWNYIRCVNDDTKWIINEAHLTNSSGAETTNRTGNDGPWNRHNIRFYNAVELNNVTSDKAIALLNEAKLEGVKISDVHPKNSQAYGLWVASYGQTVELNNCEIVAHSSKSKDLGITINDQYTDEGLAKSTLIVKNTKFVTQEGPAIMVESTAGANIILENIDISGTKDGFNAVWMEKSRKDNFDKVSVEGGTAIIQDENPADNPFMIEGNTVKVAKGVYGTLPKMANGVTIEAEEGTVFTGTSGVAGENVTIKNVRFVNEDGTKALTGNLKGTIFENCTFESEEGARWCYAYGDVVFTNCTFGSETSKRGVHFDGGNGNVTFNNCNFYSFNALGSSIPSWKLNGCNIKVSSNALSGFNGVNMYGTKYEYTNCTFEPDTYTDCTSAGNVTATYTGCSYTDNSPITSVIRFDGDASTCTVTFDGKQINFINKAASIAQAADNSELYLINGTYDMPSLSGKTITLIGQSKEKTILNMLKTGGNNPQYTAKSITYKNLTVNRPTSIYQGVNAESENFENCILKGLQFLYSNKITYTNCDFDANGAEHCSWTYGAGEVSFTGCTFTYADRGINCYSDQKSVKTKATFTDCTFTKVEGKETTGAIETNSSLMQGLELNINNCSVNEGKLWFIPKWDSEYGKKTIVTIDGKRVVATANQLTAAVNAGVVYLGGSFKMPSSPTTSALALTIVGNDTDVIDNTLGSYWENATLTFNNVKFKTSTGYANGNGSDYAALYSPNVTYNECNFSGPMRLGRDGAKFIECTFNDLGNDYVWTYGNDATFTGCTFNSEGKALLIYSDGGNEVSQVSVEGCTFNATKEAKAGAIANQSCAAIEIHNYGNGVNLTTSNNKNISAFFSGEWRIKTYEAGKPKVIVNNVEYTTLALDGKTMTIDADKNVTVQ